MASATRLDKALLSEQREQGVIDLRPGEGATFLVRENRSLMIGRVRHLERYGLATELEPGSASSSCPGCRSSRSRSAGKSAALCATTEALSGRWEGTGGSACSVRRTSRRLWLVACNVITSRVLEVSKNRRTSLLRLVRRNVATGPGALQRYSVVLSGGDESASSSA